MAGPKYHYVYRSYEPLGRSYIGKRTCTCLPEEDKEYLGSFSDLDFSPTQKEILALCVSSEHALEVEIFFHEFYDVARNPMFANKAKQTSKFFNAEGVPKSEQHKERIKDSLLGLSKTETHRLNLSLSKRGKPVSEACRLAQIAAVQGRPKSEEHKKKIAKANTGSKKSEESKKKMAQKRSENNLGRSWWVNVEGTVKFQREKPGAGWQKGRKWRG